MGKICSSTVNLEGWFPGNLKKIPLCIAYFDQVERRKKELFFFYEKAALSGSLPDDYDF